MASGSSTLSRLAIVCWLWTAAGCATTPNLIVPDATFAPPYDGTDQVPVAP